MEIEPKWVYGILAGIVGTALYFWSHKRNENRRPENYRGIILFSALLLLPLSNTSLAEQEEKPTKFLTNTVSVDAEFSNDLDPFLKFFEDTRGDMLLEDVLQEPFFALNHSSNLGFTESAWWVRVTIKNTAGRGLEYILKQDYPLIDHLDFYYPYQGGWEHETTGDRELFSQRPIDHRTFLFKLYLEPLEEKTVYFRYESQGSMNIALSLHTPQKILELVSKEQLIFGIYYGGFIVLIIYNLFIFFVVREKIFIFYTLYILSLGSFLSIHNSVSFQFIFPNTPNLLNDLLLFFLASSFFWALKFTRSILNIAAVFPLLNKVAQIFEYLMIFSWFLIPFVSYRLMIIPLGFFTVLISAHMLLMGVSSAMSGHPPARYYLLAWGALLTGVLIYMMKSFGYIPYNDFTQNAMQIGSMVEMVLLSLMLSQRVDAIKQSSNEDSLSGLYNRRYFDEKFASFFNEEKYPARPLSLIMFDLDHFKKFNDKHGHGEGDRAIRLIGRLLQSGTRKTACACRYGGEEFAVILPHTNNESALKFAERIRSQIEEDKSLPDSITVSAGVATCSSGEFNSPEVLFNAADIALYKAKKSGRNKVKNFDSEITERRASDLFQITQITATEQNQE